GLVEFSSGGHDDVHVLGPNRALEPLQHMGPAIGLFDGVDYPTATRNLLPGGSVLMLTDGVSEAFSADGEAFGPDRLATLLSERAGNDPRVVIRMVTGAVAHFSLGTDQSDDITALAVQYLGQPQST